MNPKLIAALVIVGVLAIAVIGLASAQIVSTAPNGTPNGATPMAFSAGGQIFRI